MSDEPLRLSKLMAQRGLCSRREADEFISRGLVFVDGVKIDTLGTKVLPQQTIGLALLRHGLSLDDRPLLPAQVEWINADQLRFVLMEGRKRQIRRMCDQVGLKVTGLKRVRIGRIALGKIPEGQWRYLQHGETF